MPTFGRHGTQLKGYSSANINRWAASRLAAVESGAELFGPEPREPESAPTSGIGLDWS